MILYNSVVLVDAIVLLLTWLPICPYAAEDWLKPENVLEAFEARSLRMSVSCAKKLSEFSNPEEGNFLTW